MKKKYSSEFKESSIKLALESEQSVAKTAKDLGINANTLYGWINAINKPESLNQKTASNSSKYKPEHLYDELKRLCKENNKLRQERDILKKATAYFAKTTV